MMEPPGRFAFEAADKDQIISLLPANVAASEFIRELEWTIWLSLLMRWFDAEAPSKPKRSKIAVLSKDLADELRSANPRELGLDGEEEHSSLMKQLLAIQSFSNEMAKLPNEPNALQWRRNEFIGVLLNRWVNCGGTLGGPKSNMVRFLQITQRPVLGNRSMTDAALVAFSYKWYREQPKTGGRAKCH